MTGRVFCVLVLVSLVPEGLLMCYTPNYITNQYHIEQYATAPFILVGKVVDTKQNNTHQAVKLFVTCVYKAPKAKRAETMLHQEINFMMKYSQPCEPLLTPRQSYFFFFEEKTIDRKKQRRRKKKKKNSASDFTRMSQQKKKYISLGTPIPVPEMDIMALERLVEVVKEYNPVGHCYNVWSPWSACTTQCGVGSMERTYPRHQDDKPNLSQLAVCHNAPCTQTNGLSDTDYQYQPINVNNCKSMELVRVRWCTGRCQDPATIRTPTSWEITPILMLCDINNRESLQYHNVAIPSDCGCLRPDALPKFAVIGTGPAMADHHHQRRSKKHNLKTPAHIMEESYSQPEEIIIPT